MASASAFGDVIKLIHVPRAAESSRTGIRYLIEIYVCRSERRPVWPVGRHNKGTNNIHIRAYLLREYGLYAHTTAAYLVLLLDPIYLSERVAVRCI